MANTHRRRNCLAKSELMELYEEIKEGVVQAFHNLLSVLEECRSSINGMFFKALNREC